MAAQAQTRLLRPSPWFTIKTHVAEPSTTKVFLNICTEEAIPPPPELTDDKLRYIARTEDDKDLETYYIPVVLSDIRQDADKSGKPCHVVDCVVHPVIRDIAERIPEYRTLLITIVLDQADKHYKWNLAREISVPNLKSKGKVKEFTASVPVSGETHRRRDEKSAELVEVPHYRQDVITASNEKHLSITIGVPKLTKMIHTSSTLDLEERRLILDCRPVYALDIVLESDLAPKGIDVDRATAQWRVKEGQFVIRSPLVT